MNMPSQQMDFLRENSMLQSPAIAVLSGIWLIVLLGYLLYTRRYFISPADKESASSQAIS
jgi:hypothetical protein